MSKRKLRELVKTVGIDEGDGETVIDGMSRACCSISPMISLVMLQGLPAGWLSTENLTTSTLATYSYISKETGI